MNANDQASRSIAGLFTDALPPYSSPAHYAAIIGSTELLLTLERHGADLTALDYSSRTPLSYAVENLNEAAVELLVKRKYPRKRYLGSGHVWRDKEQEAGAVTSKRISEAPKSLGYSVCYTAH